MKRCITVIGLRSVSNHKQKGSPDMLLCRQTQVPLFIGIGTFPALWLTSHQLTWWQGS